PTRRSCRSRPLAASHQDVAARRDLFVVARQFGDARPRGEDRTVGITGKRRDPSLTTQAIVLKDPAAKGRADVEKDLERFLGLYAADNAGGRPHDAGLLTGRRLVRLGGFLKKAAQTWTARQNRRDLAAPLQHRPMNQRLVQQHGRGVEEELRRG